MIRNLFINSFLLILVWSPFISGQPEVPVEKWTSKTVMFIGAHPDDDAYVHGTLAILQENRNEIYVVILTSGNVGTQDPEISMTDLARIRKQEELDALSVLGIPPEHYINLGYNDGMLEVQDKEEVISRLVRIIRTYKPDVVIAFDPGKGKMRWHKADHRAACWLAADACRAAMWPLLYEGQIIHENLEAHQVAEYLFYDGFPEDYNIEVDITDYFELKINASLKYVSQFTSGWSTYSGKDITPEDEKILRDRINQSAYRKDGRIYEQMRYYKGLPDGIGR
jgi:LmbE family N-acetylglucosaminyl deacetylase